MRRAGVRVGLVAALGVGLTLAGCSASAEPGLAAFERATTSADTVPEGVETPVGWTEIRHVGEVGDAVVYAARGPSEHPWCILVLVGAPSDGDGWVSGSSCADEPDFAERGVRVEVAGPQGRQRALLLPDDFAGELPAGWQMVQPNLAVPV